jgi:hypothetical protein
MIISTKHKILLGLLSVATVIVFSLSLLFYTLSSNEISTGNGANNSSSFATTSVDDDTKESTQFSIFSLLNRFIPN